MTWIRYGMATVFALACIGCGDDGPIGNTGSIQVAVNPATLSVPQGGSSSVTAALTRGGGFSGAVTLAVSGLPSGVTGTVTPPQLTGTTTSATVDVAAAATVALGTSIVTITATAQGVAQATATYQLTVTAAPNYALTVVPAALTIAAGAGRDATVTIDRTSFAGGVALALLNPPAGITGDFNPTPSTTNASALVVRVAANVGPGNYPLTIQGTAAGPGVRTTTLTVTVPAPPTGGNVEYLYCSTSAVPAFFAYQDGTGAWQAVTGSTSGGATRFAFNLTQGRGGVLAVFRTASSIVADALTVGRVANVSTRPLGPRGKLRARSGAPNSTVTRDRSNLVDVYQTEVLYASTTELALDGTESCDQLPSTKTVTGTVAGVPNGQFGIVSLGDSDRLFFGGTTANPITFNGVPEGLVDLVGTRMAVEGSPPDRAVIFRNLNVPNGGSLPAVIDFLGPASSVPATANATITGAAGDDLEIYVDLVTTNSHGVMWYDLDPSPATTRPWGGLNAAAMVSSDLHGIYAFAAPGGSPDFRYVLKYVGPVANQVLALGPTMNPPATSQVVAGAYPRFRFQGSFPQEYNKGASIEVLSSGNVFSIIATSAYLTAAGSPLAYDFTTPDVFGLAGFPAAARVTAGTNDVIASAFGFTGPGIFDLRPSLGSEFRAAAKSATIIVP